LFGIKSVVIFSITISLLIFSFVILSYQYEIKDGNFISRSDNVITPKEFYSKNFDADEKRIYILGSSQVIALDPTYIDNYLSKANHNYEVFNLATITDSPTQRLENLNMLISSQPEVVIYGVGPRDFQDTSTNYIENPLPDPHAFFISFLNEHKNSFGFDASLFEFPQRTTLSLIIDLVHTTQGKSDVIPYDNAPFMELTTASTIIRNDFRNTGIISSGLNPPKENIDYIALEEIILTLQDNDVRVVLFIIPQHKITLEGISDDRIRSFNLILDELHKIPNLKTYDLFYKYSDLNIWNDPVHVAINDESTIYSEDVAKMILREIQQ